MGVEGVGVVVGRPKRVARSQLGYLNICQDKTLVMRRANEEQASPLCKEKGSKPQTPGFPGTQG